MNVNNIILAFSNFLNLTFGAVLKESKELSKEENDYDYIFEIGYLQYCWETIVEHKLCEKGEYLEPYAGGADFYGLSCRVLYPEKLSSKIIFIRINEAYDYLSKKAITTPRLEYFELISFKDNFMFNEPPFDYVYCGDYKDYYIFKIIEVDFILESVSP